MPTAMTTRPVLSDAEWDLVKELLERERADLKVEIHHTSDSSFRDGLKKRLELVRELLDRLERS